ncbi:hypothetical protein DPMN_016217 [Dreissena polymorpha]|uniref:Uncharacterized protein n=1 Tax=Dreissena polymorpha TaxID=45954 RepID=A0A9D4NCX9_DREPO|nr:hypothetical protein DPMN_016217 [Dreissena polymorpha]
MGVQSATLQQTARWKQLWSVCIDDCRMFGQEKASHNVATGPCFSLSRLVMKRRLLIHGVRQTYLCDSITPL